ncbi:hypothetical protein N2152v2_000445 [Parachlorella kessleri]
MAFETRLPVFQQELPLEEPSTCGPNPFGLTDCDFGVSSEAPDGDLDDLMREMKEAPPWTDTLSLEMMDLPFAETGAGAGSGAYSASPSDLLPVAFLPHFASAAAISSGGLLPSLSSGPLWRRQQLPPMQQACRGLGQRPESLDELLFLPNDADAAQPSRYGGEEAVVGPTGCQEMEEEVVEEGGSSCCGSDLPQQQPASAAPPAVVMPPPLACPRQLSPGVEGRGRGATGLPPAGPGPPPCAGMPPASAPGGSAGCQAPPQLLAPVAPEALGCGGPLSQQAQAQPTYPTQLPPWCFPYPTAPGLPPYFPPESFQPGLPPQTGLPGGQVQQRQQQQQQFPPLYSMPQQGPTPEQAYWMLWAQQQQHQQRQQQYWRQQQQYQHEQQQQQAQQGMGAAGCGMPAAQQAQQPNLLPYPPTCFPLPDYSNPYGNPYGGPPGYPACGGAGGGWAGMPLPGPYPCYPPPGAGFAGPYYPSHGGCGPSPPPHMPAGAPAPSVAGSSAGGQPETPRSLPAAEVGGEVPAQGQHDIHNHIPQHQQQQQQLHGQRQQPATPHTAHAGAAAAAGAELAGSCPPGVKVKWEPAALPTGLLHSHRSDPGSDMSDVEVERAAALRLGSTASAELLQASAAAGSRVVPEASLLTQHLHQQHPHPMSMFPQQQQQQRQQSMQLLSGVGSHASQNSSQAQLVRQASLRRYREKKARRSFSKTIRYQMRKVNADRRPRIKGRFVKAAGKGGEELPHSPHEEDLDHPEHPADAAAEAAAAGVM